MLIKKTQKKKSGKIKICCTHKQFVSIFDFVALKKSYYGKEIIDDS
jgi:hypothetical protein